MYLVNQKTLAEALGISARQVRNLKAQGMFDFAEGTKKYNLAKCVNEYIDFKVNAETTGGASLNREKELAEHERLKKEITKIKLRKLRGEVHEASDVAEFWSNTLINFKNRLLAIPGKVAPLIISEADINVIINKIENEIYETLDELAEYSPEAVNSFGGTLDFATDEDDEDDKTEDGAGNI